MEFSIFTKYFYSDKMKLSLLVYSFNLLLSISIIISRKLSIGYKTTVHAFLHQNLDAAYERRKHFTSIDHCENC